MSPVETLKCPNCGGALGGAGFVNCPFCGSALNVQPAGDNLKRVTVQLGQAGVSLPAGQPPRFRTYPDMLVTRDTRDVPFQPTVGYGALPGGAPQGQARVDAEAIVALVRQSHVATNREDLAGYMAVIDDGDPAFYEKAKQAATEQFVKTDMKRYTTAIRFKSLTADRATYDVDVEVLIFFPTGLVNNLEATFGVEARKKLAGWRVVASAVKNPFAGIAKAGLAAGGAGALIGIIGAAVGLLVGVGVAVAVVITQCNEQAKKEEARRAAVEASPAPTPPARDSHEKPDVHGFYVATTGIPLYVLPQADAKIMSVIMPETRFRVLKEKEDWYYLEAEGGAKGWVMAVIVENNVGGRPVIAER